MIYKIHLASDDRTVEISSVKAVKKWLKNNNFYAEPNADLYGMATTIKSQGQVFIYENGNNSDHADGSITLLEGGDKLPFHRSPEEFKKYGDLGLQYAIDEGRITEADAQMIKQFVRQTKQENRIGAAREFKIMNALCNATRYIKTPFKECTIFDFYGFMEKIETGTKHKKIKGTDGEWHTIDTKQQLKPNTIRDYQRFMKRLFLWMVAEGYSDIPQDKLQKVKAVPADSKTKTTEDVFTEQEIMDMIEAASSTRDKAIIILMYEACLRSMEIGLMKWSDVDFSDPHFAVVRVRCKTEFERTIPVHTSRPYLLTWMNHYPAEIKADSPVFVNQFGQSLTYPALKKQVRIIAAKAGIKRHIKLHDFRHSGITQKVKAGWSDAMVQQVAWGHVNAREFETYTHLSGKDILNYSRQQNGIQAPPEEAQEDVLKPRQCTRCYSLNEPTARFCGTCGAPLTADVAADLQSMKDEIHADPAFLQLKAKAEEQLKLFS
ncbi:site-specific integrase [Methanoplanus limicola]|uniref:Integrase family protein n=1 Tax=Methanoplanus limicola DSM 2279 TaxID=937775 RepID=H1Z3N7_9EURY|nr:site-specific integrase [Methanoplanus limicola]EHQ35636.1 integrase family protein [Methanoplanus limicola DSM 2279]